MRAARFSVHASAPVPVTLAVTPPAGAANLPISTEVGIAITGGQVTDVALTNAGTTEKIRRHDARRRHLVDSGCPAGL